MREMLGAVDTEHVYRIVDALAAGDGPALLAEADAIAARSIAFASALDELASLFHRIATAQVVRGRARSIADGARVAAYATRLPPEAVQLAYQICVQGRADLALAPDEATGFTMTLLRLLAFEPGDIAHPAAAGRIAPGRGCGAGRGRARRRRPRRQHGHGRRRGIAAAAAATTAAPRRAEPPAAAHVAAPVAAAYTAAPAGTTTRPRLPPRAGRPRLPLRPGRPRRRASSPRPRHRPLPPRRRRRCRPIPRTGRRTSRA